MIIIVLWTIGTLWAFYFPYLFIRKIFGYIFNTTNDSSIFIDIIIFAWNGSLYISLLLLLVIRSFSKFFRPFSESIFFTTLDTLDPVLSTELQNTKTINFRTWLVIFIRRMAKLIGLAILLNIWGKIPYFGLLALPAAQFYITKNTFGVNPAIVLTIFQLAPLPFISTATKIFIVKFWIASVALSRELLEPFFSRLDDYRRDVPRIRHKNYALLFGFALPFAIILGIPILGPLSYGLAQASVATLVIELVNRQHK
eukprot:TRINITY_DN2776_c0_g1_i2.p1 TRINITY_DN2776_c0_g1~~TRINITY_DN2776_c0_g1_i2.p1  ORF type:complete len:255 (-),score=16.35 TRINITY_DN2776_c0_g1_i2:60-824(-)